MGRLKSMFSDFKKIADPLAKNTMIELYLKYDHVNLISHLKVYLSHLSAKDIPSLVSGNIALPIPPKAFIEMVPVLDYLKKLNPQRLYEWIAEARPDLALALAKTGQDGQDYMLRFKTHIIDSITETQSKATEQPEPEPEATAEHQVQEPDNKEPSTSEPTESKKRVTCEECGDSFVVTEAELANITTCPSCGSPANG